MEDVIMRLVVRVESFAYPDGTKAIGEISLDVMKGEFSGILGSNGSGKTTLLKIMDGLIKDFKGSVLLDGADVRKLSPKEIFRKVGLVFQSPDEQLFAGTVFEDVAFGPLNMGFKGKEVSRRVKEALNDVEMAGYEGKSIHNLSYGQKKRVCIAGLLAMGHEILLLDEPTAGLDPMGEYHMMSLLKKLNVEKRVTIIMATHSVDLVPLFLDRLYILSRGTIVRGGTPEEVFCSPDDMADVKLRLPQIAELIYRLKHEDKMAFEKIPLTIGEARREIMRAVSLPTSVPTAETQGRPGLLGKGYVQVYTGEGKGKTTAALGLALRAVGAGLRVFMAQFIKKEECSEHAIIRDRLRGRMTIRQYGEGFILKGQPKPSDIEAARRGLEEASKVMESKEYDLVILDEVNVAVWHHLIDLADLLDLVEKKPDTIELVITGRHAAGAIIDKADLVTEMREVKHYLKRGVPARYGIEY
jgi:cobalt/nickel transport system ATP-binding protein